MYLILDSYKKRVEICKSCDKFVDNRCLHCDCYIKAKAVLPFTSCPEKKWPNDIKTQDKRPDWFDKESQS